MILLCYHSTPHATTGQRPAENDVWTTTPHKVAETLQTIIAADMCKRM